MQLRCSIYIKRTARGVIYSDIRNSSSGYPEKRISDIWKTILDIHNSEDFYQISKK